MHRDPTNINFIPVAKEPIPTLAQWTKAWKDSKTKSFWKVTNVDAYVMFNVTPLNNGSPNQVAADKAFDIHTKLSWKTFDEFKSHLSVVRVLTPYDVGNDFDGPPGWGSYPNLYIIAVA